jgi:hypothetical protein
MNLPFAVMVAVVVVVDTFACTMNWSDLVFVIEVNWDLYYYLKLVIA